MCYCVNVEKSINVGNVFECVNVDICVMWKCV